MMFIEQVDTLWNRAAYQFMAFLLLCCITSTYETELQEQFTAALNTRDPDIQKTMTQNLSPAQEIGDYRELRSTRVVPGTTRCSFQKYTHIFRLADQLEVRAVDILLEAIVSVENKKYYFYSPEDLCFVVDDDLNVDIYQYDCSINNICMCGMYYGYVDPNVLQPEPENRQKKYLAVNGLDRKLVLDEGECVSGEMGHCTLANSTALVKLECTDSLKCVLDQSHGPLLQNLDTEEVYGVCLRKTSTVPPGESMILYENLLNSSPSTMFATCISPPRLIAEVVILYIFICTFNMI